MMKIGITMRVVNNVAYPERRDALSADWPKYLADLFPNAFAIPLLNRPDSVKEIIEDLEITGIILSNGNNWGEALERDETEKQIVEYCMINNMPVFGVCRGFQVLNIFLGGSLETNLASIGKGCHIAVEHQVSIVNKTFMQFVKNGEMTVNSFHAQGVVVEGLSSELNAFAVTNDGVVEGFFHPDKPVMAIQWHPERSSSSVHYDRQMIMRFFSEGAFWN